MNAEEIHRFWFGEALADTAEAARRMKFWYSSSAKTDALIQERFTTVLTDAWRGELASWESEARPCVSLIIVLDQFSRNIHRATPAAFQCDAQALAIARRGLARGCLDELHLLEQSFFLMPFQHSEDRAAQVEGLALFERITAAPSPEWAAIALEIAYFARLHCEIIERFGRFPHRNAILGRLSTPEEATYLASSKESFGQVARPDLSGSK